MVEETSPSFYDRFFRRETFLSPASTPVYADIRYLNGLGLDRPELFSGKDVLEIGAGLGRMTLLLDKAGYLASARSYYVIEPTTAIERIRERLHERTNIVFEQSSFQDLRTQEVTEQFDTIFCNVFAHISDEPLPTLLSDVARMLRPNGHLVLNTFYNGSSLAIGTWARKWTTRHPLLAHLAASLQTGLQVLAYGLNIAPLKRFYHRNFPYSFQQRLSKMYGQCIEYFSVPIYRITHSYAEYLEAGEKAGLALQHLAPSSLSMTLVKGPAQARLVPRLRTADQVAIIGKDWRAADFARRHGLPMSCLCQIGAKVAERKTIVLAYDYVKGPPYADTIETYLKDGFRLGETLFLFQMLDRQ